MDQIGENKPGVKRAYNSPKHSKTLWDKVKIEYERGTFNSVRELAERFGIKEFTLHSRINNKGWKEKKRQLLAKVESVIEKQTVRQLTEQESYLKRSYLRSQKYEQLIDASLSQLATTPQGIPLCEPSDIDSLSRSEMRIHELAKSALRIAPPSIDITTGGQGLGESFVSAIAKLRGDTARPKPTSEDLKHALEAEIE